MSTEVVNFPWQSAIQELALTRTRQEWGSTLEYLGRELAEAERCTFMAWRDPHWFHPASGHSYEAPESTVVGSAWLHVEPVHKSSNPGELVTGWPAEAPCWAMPMRSFGRVVGILTMEKANLPSNLEEWSTMLDLMAHSWDTVGRLEDHLAYQQQTEELLVTALESMPYYRTGHVHRVSQTASELGRLLDLSAHQRHRLQRAGRYHDVGLLISAAEHTRAGADFLRNGKVHADLASLVEHHHQAYSESLNLGLEEWVLALSEHFQEFCESHPGENADALVQRFASQHGNRHNPAVLDALFGLAVAGKLEELLPS
jgi:hypothetical protein